MGAPACSAGETEREFDVVLETAFAAQSGLGTKVTEIWYI
jgi:hypothetical protein